MLNSNIKLMSFRTTTRNLCYAGPDVWPEDPFEKHWPSPRAKKCAQGHGQTGPEGLTERASMFALSTLVHMFTVTVSVNNFWSYEKYLVMPKI